MEFAGYVDRKCVFADPEYEIFAEIFNAMFRDLRADQQDSRPPEEEVPSGIPGVRFVRRTIHVATVIAPEND